MTETPVTPDLSVIIPCYNEGENVPLLFARLIPALEALGVTFEVVTINDGSKDNTLERLLEMQKAEPRLRVIDLSRNFGKEKALSAGLFHSRGRAVVPMDADLQHPPEAIADMLVKWRDGAEVVFARRDARTGQKLSEKLFAKGFYWVFDHLSEVRLPREVGDFRLMDRKVVDTINRMPERSRFMKGIFAWVGYREAEIVYRQGERAAGTTKFNAIKLLRFAFDGLTSFSNFPLKVWSWVGAAISTLAFLYIVARLIRTMIWGVDVPGYESILMSVLFLGGVQLLTLGIIGDYLGRVFDEVKGRPLFIIRQLYEPGER
ncbi:glycosyl transferase family 2 [Paramagnetospirillum marisnigri]|uniref:Glycosyl transferase family 2 n=1 Tax=Paramagnetospirillum marisnigri TaxID=1285242 RepID=A0A178MTQ2_9PROT|nr:glycosyltransferase family 2 protein [Paramagnetospirillum marisnigri]OAN52197.1 glycosyl transferase family 2 [Paramagnetospirillum marisnigri]